MRLNTTGLLFGMLFGGLLAGANLHEYDTIHAMLALEEIDVYLLMASAIAVSAPLLWLLERRGYSTAFGGALSLRRSRPRKHHVQGGVLFGLGWAIAGHLPGAGARHGLVRCPARPGGHSGHLPGAPPARAADGLGLPRRRRETRSPDGELASPHGDVEGGCSGLPELPIDTSSDERPKVRALSG